MIIGDILPAIDVMALAAMLFRRACVYIINQVTGNTINGSIFICFIYMAGITFRLPMFTFQEKMCFAVIKIIIAPKSLFMAACAIFA